EPIALLRPVDPAMLESAQSSFSESTACCSAQKLCGNAVHVRRMSGRAQGRVDCVSEPIALLRPVGPAMRECAIEFFRVDSVLFSSEAVRQCCARAPHVGESVGKGGLCDRADRASATGGSSYA